MSTNEQWHIRLRLSRPSRTWHARLAERLSAKGYRLHIELLPELERWPGRDLLLRAERLFYGIRPALFSISPIAASDGPALACDLTIDLSARAAADPAVIQPLFDGAPGEAALFRTLLQGRAPVISIQAGYGGDNAVEVTSGHPATERPTVLSHALDQVLVRLVDLLVVSVEKTRCGEAGSLASRRDAIGAGKTSPPLLFLAKGLREAVARRLGAAKGRPAHWRLAIRTLSGPGVAERREWPPHSFTSFADDGSAFYADPFPYERDGRNYVFFEIYPYKVKKGTIGLVEVAADGRVVSAPKTVLETPFHLSYPFVFAHGGSIYMMPEISAASCVQLFRAAPFPTRWVFDRILIPDVVLGDATLVHHDGLYWIFGTIAGDGGSSWDQLGLFYARDVFGPWTPHPRNPVLVDASAARPAGAMWVEGEVLMRVAQDCRTGYGLGLTICRVDRLDTAGYAQTTLKRLGPPSGSSADGVHTLNRTSSIEVIDLRVPHSDSSFFSR